MKRILCLLLTLLALLGALPAQAQVYVEQEAPADWAQRDLMRLTVFRTGESDCMLLEAGGEAMMIDGGSNKYREKLRDALAARNISQLKYLFSTHPHDDHIDGLYRLMQYGVTAEEFLSPFPEKFKNNLQQRTVKQAEKSGIPYRQLKNGDTLSLGEANLTIYRWDAGTSVNALSALTRVEFGGSALLLCADITGDAQKYFLKTLPAEALKADVVKVPHHGHTPFVTEFLTAVDPGYIFCTNYGGKTPKTAGQAKYRSLPIQYSGDGTIIAETDGVDWYIHQLKKQF